MKRGSYVVIVAPGGTILDELVARIAAAGYVPYPVHAAREVRELLNLGFLPCLILFVVAGTEDDESLRFLRAYRHEPWMAQISTILFSAPWRSAEEWSPAVYETLLHLVELHCDPA